MYDTIIIGSGPSGITAGIYASRRTMKTLIIGKELGGQIALAGVIENYPGFKSIENFDLISKMQEQITSMGVEIKNSEIRKIEKKNNSAFTLYTEKEKFSAKTIILAIGLAPRRLAIPGEEKFSGKGVSYCANCDGPLFKNKIVAVVGGGNAGLDAAEFLSKIAKKVYLISNKDKLKAFEALVAEVKTRKNIKILLNSNIKKIIGKQKVEKIKILNNKTNQELEINADGIFIEVGRIAHTDLVEHLVKRDERSQIIVDEQCRTSCEGIFAAGDVTQVAFKQITIACGQGTIAALSAYQYLQLKKGGKAGMVLDRSIKKK